MTNKVKMPFFFEHPVFSVMTLAFAAVGVAGTVGALAEKGQQISQVAGEAGNGCVQNVKETVGSLVDEGVRRVGEWTKNISKKKNEKK